MTVDLIPFFSTSRNFETSSFVIVPSCSHPGVKDRRVIVCAPDFWNTFGLFESQRRLAIRLNSENLKDSLAELLGGNLRDKQQT